MVLKIHTGINRNLSIKYGACSKFPMLMNNLLPVDLYLTNLTDISGFKRSLANPLNSHIFAFFDEVHNLKKKNKSSKSDLSF